MNDTSARCRIFGIRSCQSMKNAFAWLSAHTIAYDFIDYRQNPPSRAQLEAWSRAVGWSTLLNTRGTTWRRLSDDERFAVDEQKAWRLMAAYPTLIKRPVLDTGDALLVGFDPARYASTFAVEGGQ